MRADLRLFTDNELIERFRLNGDERAWAALQDKYQEKIFYFTCGWFRKRGIVGNDIEDIVEEIFIRVFRSIKKFKMDGNFRAWLYAIARNKCLDEFRGHITRSATISLSEVLTPNSDVEREVLIEDAEPLIEDKIEEEELLHLLDECLDGLNERSSEVVVLHYDAELNCSEISRMIQISPGAVQGRLNSAVLLLRRCIRLKVGFEF